MANCLRCGREKYNPSRLCEKCLKELRAYMAQHPLSNYESIPLMRRENEERWNDFINEGKKNG